MQRPTTKPSGDIPESASLTLNIPRTPTKPSTWLYRTSRSNDFAIVYMVRVQFNRMLTFKILFRNGLFWCRQPRNKDQNCICACMFPVCHEREISANTLTLSPGSHQAYTMQPLHSRDNAVQANGKWRANRNCMPADITETEKWLRLNTKTALCGGGGIPTPI